jgi:hypothetical protein
MVNKELIEYRYEEVRTLNDVLAKGSSMSSRGEDEEGQLQVRDTKSKLLTLKGVVSASGTVKTARVLTSGSSIRR